MRSDDLLMLDMLLAAKKIQQFTAGKSREQFTEDALVQSAVLREFQVIGEAARQVSMTTKSLQVSIAWSEIAGMRNHIIHGYFNVDLDIVWDTIQDDIPQLIGHLENIVPPQDNS